MIHTPIIKAIYKWEVLEVKLSIPFHHLIKAILKLEVDEVKLSTPFHHSINIIKKIYRWVVDEVMIKSLFLDYSKTIRDTN